MDDADRIATIRRYLRRTYATNLAGLRRLADTVASGATEVVTITGMGLEGGSSSGQITFERMAYLSAIEDVIAEIDPDAVIDTPSLVQAKFN
jgi:hypothetical protein